MKTKEIKFIKNLKEEKNYLNKIIKRMESRERINEADIHALSRIGSNILFEARWRNFGL